MTAVVCDRRAGRTGRDRCRDDLVRVPGLTAVAAPAYLYRLPGLTSYAEGLRLQQELAAARSQHALPDTIVVLEHEPVVTLGPRTDAAPTCPTVPRSRRAASRSPRPTAAGARRTTGPGSSSPTPSST